MIQWVKFADYQTKHEGVKIIEESFKNNIFEWLETLLIPESQNDWDLHSIIP